MDQPFIDVEERIDRVVGRRTRRPDALSLASSRKADAIAWRRAFGGLRVSRGVYRFRSHEESREPTLEDLRDLCRALNERGARYVVIGGFAVRAAGYNRRTMDVDLIVAADSDNEARVFDALATLPGGAAATAGR